MILALPLMLFVGCKKDHYDVSQVHGVNAEGELLLPIASKSITIGKMMERFELMDVVNWSESGDLSFGYGFENMGVVQGSELLKFNDLNYEEDFTFENPCPTIPFPYYDTVVSFEKTIVFESENVRVIQSQMKSGRLNFMMESNFGNVERVVLRSSDIKDAGGHDLMLDTPVQANSFGFDLEGLQYETDTANMLKLSFDLYIHVRNTSDPELFVDLKVEGRDLAFSEMFGYVDAFSSRNTIDSSFFLFPDNVEGMLEVKGVRVKVSERNTFNLGAHLIIDTALVYNEGMPPYSILEPLPLFIDLPPQKQFSQVLDRTFSGKINASGGRIYSSSNFVVNPVETSELVWVSDTSRIDTRVEMEIPFTFTLNEIGYFDSVDMNLSGLELPDMIEKLTLELSFTSTIPINLKACFCLYDSENNMVTDTLIADTDLIEASFDGRPKTTKVNLVINEKRIENAMHSDRIIMSYQLDSDAHDVKLNAHQKLDLFLKAKVNYRSNADF